MGFFTFDNTLRYMNIVATISVIINLVVIIYGISYCDFPNQMMSDIIISTPTIEKITMYNWGISHATIFLWHFFWICFSRDVVSMWTSIHFLIFSSAIPGVLAFPIDTHNTIHAIFGGIWGYGIAATFVPVLLCSHKTCSIKFTRVVGALCLLATIPISLAMVVLTDYNYWPNLRQMAIIGELFMCTFGVGCATFIPNIIFSFSNDQKKNEVKAITEHVNIQL